MGCVTGNHQLGLVDHSGIFRTPPRRSRFPVQRTLAVNLWPRQNGEFAPESIAKTDAWTPQVQASLTDFTISRFEVFLPRSPLSRSLPLVFCHLVVRRDNNKAQ